MNSLRTRFALVLGIVVVTIAVSVITSFNVGYNNLGKASPWTFPELAVGSERQASASFSHANYTSYVALCLVVKDESLDIREWVAYHHSIGVERIYVYDDGSVPPLKILLTDYIVAGVVKYHYLTGPLQPGVAQQVAVYSDCLQQHATQHTWMGAWDNDEFIIIRSGLHNLEDVLRAYEAYGGVGVTWRVFGSPGYQSRPPGGLLVSYTNCTAMSHPKNSIIKSIVNTQFAVAAVDPHHFKYKQGYYAVNTNFERCIASNSPSPLDNVLVMNHYFSRSVEDFQKKIIRGSAMGRKKNWSHRQYVDNSSVEHCTYAVRLGEELQRKVQINAVQFLAGNSTILPASCACV